MHAPESSDCLSLIGAWGPRGGALCWATIQQGSKGRLCLGRRKEEWKGSVLDKERQHRKALSWTTTQKGSMQRLCLGQRRRKAAGARPKGGAVVERTAQKRLCRGQSRGQRKAAEARPKDGAVHTSPGRSCAVSSTTDPTPASAPPNGRAGSAATMMWCSDALRPWCRTGSAAGRAAGGGGGGGAGGAGGGGP